MTDQLQAKSFVKMMNSFMKVCFWHVPIRLKLMLLSISIKEQVFSYFHKFPSFIAAAILLSFILRSRIIVSPCNGMKNKDASH